MIRHACPNNATMFVVSKESNVLFLLVHAYAVKQPTKNWCMTNYQKRH